MTGVARLVAPLALLLAACGSKDEAPPAETPSEDAGAEATGPLPDPITDECITDGSAGSHDFECDSIKFTVNVPKQCLEHACGVILDVHGWFMTGADEEREAHLAESGAKHDFIVIQPTANIGPAIPPFPEGPSWSFDYDAPLLHDFLMRAIDGFHADPKRIHVTGFSQGGMMTWRFLCEHSQMLASVAPGAANSGYPSAVSAGGICKGEMPAERIPVLYLHGTKDALVAYAGAEVTRDTIVDQWGMKEDETVQSDATHEWKRWVHDDGMPFEFIRHDYKSSYTFLEGHCFPGSDSKGILACLGKNAFVWGDAVVEFFVAHPKP